MVVLSRQNSNLKRVLCRIAATFVITSVTLNCAYAADGYTLMPVRYRLTEDGNTIFYERRFDDTAWTPTGSYCTEDHRAPDNNRYEHSHLPHGFPFTHNGNTVTVQKSDWAWDAYYSATRLSNSTFSKNCFAYAEGAPTVMFAAAWWNNFTNSAYLPDGTSFGSVGHAIKIEGVYQNTCTSWVISLTSEKNASGGVYRSGWLPLGILPLPWEWLREHK
jgi:hypothetical protein